jgi:hypothetical protein
MSRWFRFYANAMRNAKVLRLSDKDFRLWVRLLAVASENDGRIPDIADLKLALGMRLDHLKEGLNRLISGGLIDALDTGYEPHNWSKFQYKSDTSNERVAKHRASRNVTVTPPDTEAETETEKKEIPVGAAPPASVDKLLFDHGLAILSGAGIKDRQARSMLGKWKATYGAGETLAAIGQCQREGAVEPIAFIEGYFRSRVKRGAIAGNVAEAFFGGVTV